MTNFPRLSRGDIAWMVVVAVVYLPATVAVTGQVGPGVDRMMLLAGRLSSGYLDVPTLAGQYDTVAVGAHTHLAFSLLPTVPYLVFVPFSALSPYAKDVIPLVLGIVAAWLCLPLARGYGRSGRVAFWVASLGAFGTVLLYSSALRQSRARADRAQHRVGRLRGALGRRLAALGPKPVRHDPRLRPGRRAGFARGGPPHASP